MEEGACNIDPPMDPKYTVLLKSQLTVTTQISILNAQNLIENRG